MTPTEIISAIAAVLMKIFYMFIITSLGAAVIEVLFNGPPFNNPFAPGGWVDTLIQSIVDLPCQLIQGLLNGVFAIVFAIVEGIVNLVMYVVDPNYTPTPFTPPTFSFCP